MTDSNLVMAIIILPLAGSAFGFTAKIFRHGKSETILEWTAAITGLVLPLLLLLLLYPAAREGLYFSVGNQGLALGIIHHFDGLAWCLDIMIFLSMLIAWVYTRGAGPKGPLFTSVFLILTASLAASASCNDLFNLFVCFELSGICSYVLIALSGKPKAWSASLQYLIVGSSSMCFFLLGVFGIYRVTGSLAFHGINDYLKMAPVLNMRPPVLSLVIIVAATLVRVGVIPVASWLPGAHGAAPHGVSAVLSGVVLKVPLFALGRLLAVYTREDLLPYLSKLWYVLGITGAVTALAGVMGALIQRDAKKLLACHSISQIGYIVSAWSLASPSGFAVAFLYSFFHSIFKGLLFLSAGTATDIAASRDVYTVRGLRKKLSSCGDKAGITFVCFMIAAFSISAIPPFIGFAGKNAVVYLFKGNPFFYWTLVIAGIGTIASMVKLSAIFFDGKAVEESRDSGPGKTGISVSMKIAMIAWGLCCVLLGIFIFPVSEFTAELFHADADMVPRDLYNAESLGNMLIYIACAAALFWFVKSKKGMKLSHALRSIGGDFSLQVFAFSLLLAGIALAVLVF